MNAGGSTASDGFSPNSARVCRTWDSISSSAGAVTGSATEATAGRQAVRHTGRRSRKWSASPPRSRSVSSSPGYRLRGSPATTRSGRRRPARVRTARRTDSSPKTGLAPSMDARCLSRFRKRDWLRRMDAWCLSRFRKRDWLRRTDARCLSRFLRLCIRGVVQCRQIVRAFGEIERGFHAGNLLRKRDWLRRMDARCLSRFRRFVLFGGQSTELDNSRRGWASSAGRLPRGRQLLEIGPSVVDHPAVQLAALRHASQHQRVIANLVDQPRDAVGGVVDRLPGVVSDTRSGGAPALAICDRT
jgi:hypothetical protein